MAQPRTVIKKTLSDVNRPPSSTSAKSSNTVAELEQYQQNGMSFKDYMTMKVLPPEQQQVSSQQPPSQSQSNYKAGLASQKYFTPKELNALNLSKKGAEGAKPIVREELKKSNGPVKVQHNINQHMETEQKALGSSLD